MDRPSWDQTWMAVAQQMAARSRCASRQVGAVVVTEGNRPVSVGYNGPPAGYALDDAQDCSAFCPRRQNNDQTRDYDNCVTVHAEINALMFADRRDYEGGTLYVTSSICWDCGKAVANSGLSTVIMQLDEQRDKHRDPERTIAFLESCGLDVIVHKEG